MASVKEIKVPDIGASDVEVIEILVNPGDSINKDDSLITLESDKASMEIPSPESGTVESIAVNVGDKVSEGALILQLTMTAAANSDATSSATQTTDTPTTASSLQEIHIPDIGTSAAVDVIEINVSVGDNIEKDATLITLESDKASMEIPAPISGEIKAIHINVGDKATTGQLIVSIASNEAATPKADTAAPTAEATKAPAEQPATSTASPKPAAQVNAEPVTSGIVHAGPSVRRFARELGVDLSRVTASGRKNRILKHDVQAYVKAQLSSASGSSLSLASAPQIDFSQFGDIETQPLSKINKLTGANLHRNWVNIPHVTQFDEADITELEAFRKAQKTLAEKQGFKLTPLVFLMKAVVAGLKAYPRFNTSLDNNGEQLIVKKYYNIGVAVDTPNGLVVPVVRDVDQKSLFDLAKELGEISVKARNKKLTSADMQGSCFTISSLGGIGGTAFTPIINAPDVAILGVSKSSIKPFYQDGQFVPRLMLPLSLSYDHRVIDGADAARFCACLTQHLSDIRRLLL